MTQEVKVDHNAYTLKLARDFSRAQVAGNTAPQYTTLPKELTVDQINSMVDDLSTIFPDSTVTVGVAGSNFPTLRLTIADKG